MQAVLFDFDGVVVQSEGVYDQATQKLGEHYGVDIPDRFYDENRGVGETAFYKRFKTFFNLDVGLEDLSQVGKIYLWDAFAQSVRVTPGFLQFFEKLTKLVPYRGLVTATPRPLISEIFKNSKLEVDFDYVVTASDVDRTKPYPDPYLKACEYFDLRPESVLVIEDSLTGLTSAISAGCITVGITTSCTADTLKEANFIVDSFGELEELLTIV